MKKKTVERSEVIKRVVAEVQHRDFTFERSAIDAEKRTVDIAFSSEMPVERWWGTEILDHSGSSVRLQRMNDGGAILFNHDTDQHIGVVERARVDGDRVGRATVRFGNSSLANEKFQDVQDGILRHVSVGYMIHKIESTQDGNGENQIERVVDWEPIEISFVPVPADASVGVGRSHEDKEQSDKEVEELRKQLTASTEDIERLRSEVAAKDAAILNYKSSESKKDAEIAELNVTIGRNKADDIARYEILNKETAALRGEIEKLKEEVKDKDTEGIRLAQSLAAKGAFVVDLEDSLAENKKKELARAERAAKAAKTAEDAIRDVRLEQERLATLLRH